MRPKRNIRPKISPNIASSKQSGFDKDRATATATSRNSASNVDSAVSDRAVSVSSAASRNTKSTTSSQFSTAQGSFPSPPAVVVAEIIADSSAAKPCRLETIDTPSLSQQPPALAAMDVPLDPSPVLPKSQINGNHGQQRSEQPVRKSRSRSSRSSRRSNSDIPVSVAQPQVHQHYPQQPPPGYGNDASAAYYHQQYNHASNYFYPPPGTSPLHYSNGAPNGAVPSYALGGAYPPPPQQQQQYGSLPPQSQQALSSRGAAAPPSRSEKEQRYSLGEETQPLMNKGVIDGAPPTATAKKNTMGRHRKSLSGSAALPAYGSLFIQPPPPPPSPMGGNGGETPKTQKFSPRAELRKFGLSPRTQARIQPPDYPPSSPRGANLYGYGSTGSNGGGGAAPPPMMPPYSLQQAPSFGSHASYNEQQPLYTPTSHPLYSPREFGPSPNNGEKAFLQSPHGGSNSSGHGQQHRRSDSTIRKMHFRQHSAQLYMQDARGTTQPLACRNVAFLLLFVFHLVVLGYVGQIYGPQAMEDHNNGQAVTLIYSNLVHIAVWSGLFSAVVSTLLLVVMIVFAQNFVQICLFVVITLSFVWGTIGIGLSPKTVVPVTGIIALALAVAYTFIVWDRIPFATANLSAALAGIRDHPGTVAVAFGLQVVALVWAVSFSIVCFGVYDAIQEKTLELSNRMHCTVLSLLGLSFYWTFQVLQGTIQTVTAGVIGGWWHRGSTDENKSLVRTSCFTTLFYSMGSICFGSLFVGPARVLRQLSIFFRPSTTETSSLLFWHEFVHCIQSCMSSCVDSIAAGFNAWAFTYIGMYNYGFLEGGHHATELFEKRGWSTIVSDDLVPNILMFTSLVIGGVTGCFAHFLSRYEQVAVRPMDEPGLAPFVEGVIIGLVLPSLVFSVIEAAVNAVLVCFASSPVNFEENHPELSHDMQMAWREVWPGALDVHDLRSARNVVHDNAIRSVRSNSIDERSFA